MGSNSIITGRKLANPEATCEVAVDACVLFSEDSESLVSAVFEVGATMKQVKVFERELGSIFTLEMVYGPNGGTYFVPFVGSSGPQTIGAVTNYYLIPWPGRYRLRYSGVPSTAVVVCEDVACCNAQVITGAS